jgi:hypothetical protein
MPRYNWRYPLGRLTSASFVVFCWTFSGHGGVDAPLGVEHVICNGDLRDSLLVFSQLIGAAVLIEVLSWAVWFVHERPRVNSAHSGIDILNKPKLSGGELLGLEGSIYSLAFAIALVVFSARVIGISNPCSPMNLNPFSLRHLMSALLAMYGILGAINYLLEKVDRPLDKLPV